MTRNNIKLLTAKELRDLSERYVFEMDSDKKNILVKTRNGMKITYHKIDQPFRINIIGERVVVFSMDAIEIWKELYEEYKYSLFYVQNAVNKLIVTFQKVDTERVKEILTGKDIKIKEL